MRTMRSYRQYCGVARSLDVIGDRWTLLVVRELLVRPCRFTDLVAGVPGIPRNLLAERLRSLEAAGLVAREDERYVATDRGTALKPVLRELIRWSVPLMLTGQGDDAVRGHWAGGAAEALFADTDLAGLAGLEVGVEADGEELALRVEDGRLRSVPGPAADPDVVLRGTLEGVMATLAGVATDRPVEVTGRLDRLAALGERCRTVPAA